MKKILVLALSTLFLTATTLAHGYVNGLYISVAPQDIQFHLMDFNNHITGYTPSGTLKQIPNISAYKAATITSSGDVSELGYYDKFHFLEQAGSPVQIYNGKYYLVVYGINMPVTAEISIDLDWSENIQWNAKYQAKHLIYPSTVWTYEFEVPATPPLSGQLMLIKAASPNDLIKDITTASQLGYIGNVKFVNELIKEMQEIEKERTEVQKPDEKNRSQGDKEKEHLTPAQKAIKAYKELLEEITKKYQRPQGDDFVKQEAYTVLKEDLDYIIGHIQ